jgi:FAD/FMN-containing dehydrogenase
MMEQFIDKLRQKGFEGDIDTDATTREKYSHDASLFEVMPALVVAPKSTADIERLVGLAAEMKTTMPELSLTARSAGTDMSGGAINDSVIVDFNRYLNVLHEAVADHARVQPGMFYREFEKETLKNGAFMPSFPASRELCTVGGMVANNSGGELSLRYGKIENYVNELQVTFADGKTYSVRPLAKPELDAKMAQGDYEGEIYRKTYELIEANYDKIKAAKPHVSKNSTGYNLWNVWDRQTGIFDMTQLVIGSQGTLGLVTDINLRLIPQEPYSGVLVAFMRNIDNLGEVVNEVVARKPASFESFDNYTLYLSIKFFLYFHKTLGWGGLIRLGWSLIPDAFLLFRGIPKMILLIEFTGATQEEVNEKIKQMHVDLKKYKLQALEDDETPQKAWKFRIMRRESFNLLRKKVKDKHTAPFIDDFVVPPAHLVEFLPQLRQIINKYKLFATVAGHMGDGNFHVIPLMKIEEESERAKIQPAMKEVNDLVLKYGGSLSGEHNDGMIRGPWLEQMYGKEMVDLFRQTKQIFDPKQIFNPHKKANADWQYSMAHVREHF